MGVSNRERAPDLSRDGVLFVSGFAVSLRVERGQLAVRSGEGRNISECRFPKVSVPRLRRLIVLGKGGYTTWGALSWLDGIGASFVHLDRSGRVVAASGKSGPDQPGLRRAQALAMDGPVGLAVTRYLLTAKLEGQRGVLSEALPLDPDSVRTLDRAIERVSSCNVTHDAVANEARAAKVYWRAWKDQSVKFSRADRSKVPAHWLVVGDRHSPLSSSPRRAVTPAGAIFNYLYALAESECRLAALAIGLDPGLGWTHRDTPYRDSAALDLLEAIRPEVDVYVSHLLSERTFARREFVEQSTGQVILSPPLARSLASSSLLLWERAIAPVAEEVARLTAAGAASPIRVRTRLTQADRKRGRARPNGRLEQIPSSPCRICGVTLANPDRAYCDSCLPTMDRDRTKKLAAAGRETLAAMRASADDPARTPEALAKLAATSRSRMLAIRSWEREHGKVIDSQRYEAVILPSIRTLTVPALMAATSLSQHYCWQVRTGRKRLHPMHWDAVRAMADRGQRSDGLA
jgi:CRISPR-associated endonuclease Cas1